MAPFFGGAPVGSIHHRVVEGVRQQKVGLFTGQKTAFVRGNHASSQWRGGSRKAWRGGWRGAGSRKWRGTDLSPFPLPLPPLLVARTRARGKGGRKGGVQGGYTSLSDSRQLNIEIATLLAVMSMSRHRWHAGRRARVLHPLESRS